MVEEHKNHNTNYLESGASEYELYFNYMFKYHKEDIIVRDLRWSNVSKNSLPDNYLLSDYNYISICSWIN